MKKIIFVFIILPELIAGLQINGQFDYNYYYFQTVNYYNENRLIIGFAEDRGLASFYLQGIGQYYIGNPRFTIPYPSNMPDYLRDMLPSYYQLANSMTLSHAYISIFWKGINVKLGKFPMKWGISQTYAPADIYGNETPMDYFYIREGIWGLSAAYSFGDNTVSFIYQDNPEYKKTKQGVLFENINNYFTYSICAAHLFKSERMLNGLIFNTDTTEYALIGMNAVTDLWGPGLWAEADYFYNMDSMNLENSHYYIIAGIDYTFYDFVYTSLEYIYYSDGRSPQYTFSDLLLRYLNDDYLIGKHYLIPIIGINKGEKLSGEALFFTNMEDRSSLALFNINYQPRDYLCACFSMTFFNGDDNQDFSGLPPVYNFNLKFLY